jgi:fluoroacetyl-CoA thioesterase
MKDTLQPGISYEHRFVVPQSKTVPALYPEADEFLAMPEVFATGFLVGLLEWTCIRAIIPHVFTVEAHDGVDLISAGRHERFVIYREQFDAKVSAKRHRAHPQVLLLQ